MKAQQQIDKNSEIKPYKWDVGADLLWLIDKNSVPPSVFVRLNTDKNNRLSAYRFRLGGDYTEHLNAIDTLSSTQTKTNLKVFASLGKEWQKQYDQFQLFYGSDLFLNYRLFIFEYSKDEEGFFPKERDISLGVSPFVGMRYFLSSRISFSTEAHLNIYFHEWDKKTFYANPDPWAPLEVVRHRVHYLKMNVNPIYALNLHYHF